MMNVISETRVHDECYFRNMSCTLNNISTILAIFQSVAVHHDIGLYTKRDDADVHTFLFICNGQISSKKSLKIPKGGNQNPYIEEEQTTQ